MGWTLVDQADPNAEAGRLRLRDNHTTYLSLASSDGRVVLSDVLQRRNRALAALSVGGWGVKLRALQDLAIHPAHPRTNPLAVPSQEQYHVESNSDQPEVIFLRPDDKISFPDLANPITLVLKYDTSEVQVDSSVAGDAEVAESKDTNDASNGRTLKQSEQEEEESTDTDDEDLDGTDRRRTRSTPNPSLSRSEIVQETPTANRIYPVSEFSAGRGELRRDDTVAETVPETVAEESPEMDEGAEPNAALELEQNGAATPNDEVESRKEIDAEADTVATGAPSTVQNTASSAHNPTPSPPENEDEDHTILQAQSNLTAQRSPFVRITKTYGRQKRKIQLVDPQDEEEEEKEEEEEAFESAPAPPAKRARKSTNANEKNQPTTPTRRTSTPAKRKPRSSDTRSLMPSAETNVKNYWSTRTPKVAFSNSKAAEMKNLIRFLKSHHGTVVDTVQNDNSCNLLVVRDGSLRKSTKLLTALALGIPVVTDEWLPASARAGTFLPPADFVPSVVEQEIQVGFVLRKVWGVPQSRVLQGLKLFFTPALRRFYPEWAEVEEVCRVAGAEAVGAIKSANSALKEFGDEGPGEDVVFLGLEEGDPDARGLVEKGFRVFNREFFTTGILRGEVDVRSEEFRIKEVGGSQMEKGRSKGRKSRKA
ncbi:uncharacterized protein EI97DRAFT_499391 [Westerdykella ornata]|uniref:BRCT domain-containing protein n=1 Tax=Westerdykella ornata TaxID=318751 RepID=A0A6A6JR25_WESOR|nr:uncharacterized protein EI97DRAFT_499391 [Westerdykella ornata]KAF2278837.1 hypothetical protein EI97DRAFT_499391 [Westerdykella ornata]